MIKQKHFQITYFALLAFAAALFALMSARDAVWADEAYTFAMVHHSFREMWRITAADVHPPLYYLLAKPFLALFGYSQYAGRLFSGLWYLALLAVTGQQLKKLFDEKTALLFMVLFLLYPYGLGFAAEVRMYSLAAFCVSLNALYAYRAWRFGKTSDWALFAVGGICAAYTHYFALVSAGIIYGLLFLCILAKKRKLLKPWLLASFATILAYLPWLKSFVEQLAFKVSNDYWIEPIRVKTLVSYVLELFRSAGVETAPFFFGLVLLAALVIVCLKKDSLSLLALSVPILTVLLGVGVSIAIRPIFVIRYLAPAAPLLIFFLARALAQVEQESLCACLASAVLVCCLSNLLYEIKGTWYDFGTLDAAFAAECSDADCYIVSSKNSLHISQTLAFYAPDKDIYVPDALGADNPYPNKHRLDTLDTAGMTKIILLTSAGKQPDEALTQGFRAVFSQTVHDLNNEAGVWILTK